MNSVSASRSERLRIFHTEKLFLALVILLSADLALAVTSFLLDLSGFIMLIIDVLLVIGLWTLRQSALTGQFKTYSFSMIKVRPIAMAIIIILLIVLMLFILVSAGMLVDKALLPAIDYIKDGTVPEGVSDEDFSKLVIDSLKENGNIDLDALRAEHGDLLGEIRDFIAEYAKTVAYIACAIGIAVCVVLTVCAFKVSSAISAIRNTLLFGYDEPIKTTFICAVLYVLAGFQVIGAVTGLIGAGDAFADIISVTGARVTAYGAVLTTVQSAVGAATTVLAAIYFNKVKTIME